MKYLKRLFKKKELEKSVVTEKKAFNIDEFNNWFNNEYEGYDGRKGAAGIFLRTDKLSNCMISDYFEHLGYSKDEAEQEAFTHYDIIRKDWRAKLANR